MLLIAAALLVGSLLASIECVFIIRTCGPYWVGPVLFFQTWAFYALAACVGLIPLHLLFRGRHARRGTTGTGGLAGLAVAHSPT